MSEDRKELAAKVRAAGVVGAGGAGFPTHVKIDAAVETVIVNGAECEPLLYKDKELLRLESERMIDGLSRVVAASGAKRGVIALKDKKANREAIAMYKKTLAKPLEMFLLGDYYPAGDEVLLVYDVTGKVPPFGGIPLDVGAMNSNVETFIWIADAVRGKPVTHKWVTVAGAVAHPMTMEVPVGTSFLECLAAAGGATAPEYKILGGGVMMGKPVGSDDIVDKTSGGWVVLPKDHPTMERRVQERPVYDKIGKSACDQCMYCTEFCPRYLVGHPIQPHRVMRTLGISGPTKAFETEWAQACIHCGLCGLYACPESLSPNEISWDARGNLFGGGFPMPPKTESKPHPMYEDRKVPLPRLVARLGLGTYDVSAHFEKVDLRPARVRLRLKQHAGVPSVPVVSAGSRIAEGDLVAEIPEGKLGARVHASIGGWVESVTEKEIVVKREDAR